MAKYLARCGLASRRKCEETIRAGWVRIDGEVILSPEVRIVPESCRVEVRGKKITPPETHRYILLNKPVGVLCTSKPGKEKGRTIFDLVQVPERVFSIGRLDRDTSGLLLLTNDGELTQRLTHPSFEKEKEYLIETSHPVREEELSKLRKGIQLEDGISVFSRVERVGEKRLKVILSEGRKRQIRRTLKAVGLSVKKLHRIRIGDLTLGDLPSGSWRDLKPSELQRIK